MRVNGQLLGQVLSSNVSAIARKPIGGGCQVGPMGSIMHPNDLFPTQTKASESLKPIMSDYDEQLIGRHLLRILCERR